MGVPKMPAKVRNYVVGGDRGGSYAQKAARAQNLLDGITLSVALLVLKSQLSTCRRGVRPFRRDR